MPVSKKHFRKRYNELKTKGNEALFQLYEAEHTDVEDEVLLKLFEERGLKAPEKKGEVQFDECQTKIIELSELKGAVTEEPKKLGMTWMEGVPFAAGIVVILFTMHYNLFLALVLGCATTIGLFFLFRIVRRHWRKLAVKDQYSKDL